MPLLWEAWHLPKTPRPKPSHKVKSLLKSLLSLSGMTQSRRSRKWDVRLSKTVCSRPVWTDQNPESRTLRPKSQASLLSSRSIKGGEAFTAANPFHKLPGKS
jgi:hypothetical protein